MQKLISNQNHLLENDLKSKSDFKNLISNRDFKSFDFKSYPTLIITLTRQELMSAINNCTTAVNTTCTLTSWSHLEK